MQWTRGYVGAGIRILFAFIFLPFQRYLFFRLFTSLLLVAAACPLLISITGLTILIDLRFKRVKVQLGYVVLQVPPFSIRRYLNA